MSQSSFLINFELPITRLFVAANSSIISNKCSSSTRVIHSAPGRIAIDGCSPNRLSVCKIPYHKQKLNALQIASLNVGSMRKRSSKVIEMI